MKKEKLTKKELFKTVLIILSTIFVQMIIYYIGHYFGYRAHLLMPRFIDNLIPQNTNFVYFYVFWYPMLIYIPLVLGYKDNMNFKKYVKSIFIALIITLIIFIAYPTIMDRPVLIVSTFSDWILSLVHKISTPTKCIPSLHVVLSTLFIISSLSSKNLSKTYRIINIIISFIIILSTMFLKQHYFIDVITGVIVALGAWLLAKVRIKRS